uniref:Capsid protein n=1 Tax=Parvoviridae sp. TaxID=1940570 RepID=A0A7D3UGP6_9VIRU|nr:MAG: capsid protein [Parvoviridae sp.]
MAAEGVVPDWLENFIKKRVFRPIGRLVEGAKHRGAVLPGYKYLGPFNSLDKGEPVNAADAAALEHDKAYDEQLKEGKNPYLTFNKADEKFMKDLEGDRSLGGNLAKALFQAKKRVLEPLGGVDLAKGDKISDYFPAKKKARVEDAGGGGEGEEDPGEGTSDKGGTNQQDGNAGDTGGGGEGGASSAGGSNIMAEGAGAPMGGDNQGADGVGNSSGNWHCDSQWMGDHVVTTTTRTWVLPPYNNYLYKAITSSTSNADNAYAGFSTPWGYFDFNRFHCHFSPRDWQRLINNNVGFRPRAMRVKIFNIQVKEVTVQEGNTTIANNLTSTVQIFADKGYLLPYVMDGASEGTMPPFPADVYQLPQYGYLTFHKKGSDSAVEFSDRSAFYCLEYFRSDMLRTGNNFEFTYEFEDVPFHASYAHSQFLDRTFNPLLDQYLWGLNIVENKTAKWAKIGKENAAARYRNWVPGPKIRDCRIDAYPGGTENATSFQGWSSLSKWNINERANYTRPGLAAAPHDINDTSDISGSNNLVFPKDPHTSATSGDINSVNITDETEIITVNGVGSDPWGVCSNNTQKQNTNPTTENMNWMGAYPGMVWQNRDVYLQGPIWAKIPDTESRFHPAPHMGGFGLKRPPPQIFIKNTPVPANPPAEFSSAKWGSYINQYSTGQISVEIVWELQKEASKRWNPEIQFTSNFGTQDNTSIAFAPNNAGDYAEPRLIGTRYLSKHL